MNINMINCIYILFSEPSNIFNSMIHIKFSMLEATYELLQSNPVPPNLCSLALLLCNCGWLHGKLIALKLLQPSCAAQKQEVCCLKRETIST